MFVNFRNNFRTFGKREREREFSWLPLLLFTPLTPTSNKSNQNFNKKFSQLIFEFLVIFSQVLLRANSLIKKTFFINLFSRVDLSLPCLIYKFFARLGRLIAFLFFSTLHVLFNFYVFGFVFFSEVITWFFQFRPHFCHNLTAKYVLIDFFKGSSIF